MLRSLLNSGLLFSIIQIFIRSRRSVRQGANAEQAQQPCVAVSRHRRKRRGMMEYIGLMSLNIVDRLHDYGRNSNLHQG